MAEYGESLTEREIELMQMVATGASNREIAYRLGISANTVKVHLRNIFAKLGAESRTEATMIAVREGVIIIPDIEPIEETADVEQIPTPVPPLPLWRRLALVIAAGLVTVVTFVTWPRPAETDSVSNNPLPPRINEDGSTLASLGEDSLWSEQAQMPTRRAGLAVAMTGDRIYAIGGEGIDGVTDVTEIYDPVDDTWERVTNKPTSVAYVSAAVIEGLIYVPGGCTDTGTATQVVEVYDPQADAWETRASLPAPLCAYALASYGGQIYVFGGTNGEQAVAETYLFDPQTDSWQERAPMPDPRTVAAATTLGERLYVVGGYRDGQELRNCTYYDPAADTWHECAPLIAGRSGLGLAAVGGKLYAIGGGEYLGFNERYDPANDLWAAIETPLTGVWQSPGMALHGATVYVIGGWSRDYVSLNMAFEPMPFQIFVPSTVH